MINLKTGLRFAEKLFNNFIFPDVCLVYWLSKSYLSSLRKGCESHLKAPKINIYPTSRERKIVLHLVLKGTVVWFIRSLLE